MRLGIAALLVLFGAALIWLSWTVASYASTTWVFVSGVVALLAGVLIADDHFHEP